MEPILNNLSGATFLLTAESGIIISSFDRNVGAETIFVYDHSVGYDVGSVYFNATANYTISGILNNTSGIAAASPGITLVLSNTTTGNGVDDGGVYTDTIGTSHGEKALRSISVSATQKAGIA